MVIKMKEQKSASDAVREYRSAGEKTDPLGSYTGTPYAVDAVFPSRPVHGKKIDPAFPGGKRYLPPERYYDLPTQDADDL